MDLKIKFLLAFLSVVGILLSAFVVCSTTSPFLIVSNTVFIGMNLNNLFQLVRLNV